VVTTVVAARDWMLTMALRKGGQRCGSYRALERGGKRSGSGVKREQQQQLRGDLACLAQRQTAAAGKDKVISSTGQWRQWLLSDLELCSPAMADKTGRQGRQQQIETIKAGRDKQGGQQLSLGVHKKERMEREQ